MKGLAALGRPNLGYSVTEREAVALWAAIEGVLAVWGCPDDKDLDAAMRELTVQRNKQKPRHL